MGKVSKLKTSGTRYEYQNGDRKLYDPNAVPKGCDEDVWSLALYFEQRAEEQGWSVEGRPIIYTVLYGRIEKNFPELLDKPHEPVVHSSFVGEGGTPYTIIETMIDNYYSNYISNKPPSINDFCSVEYFDNLKDYTIINNILKNSLKNSTVVEVSPSPIQIARPAPLDKPALTCYDGSTGDETAELQGKLDTWREKHNELGFGD